MPIKITTIYGATFITINQSHLIDKRSLVGDWEGAAWGDGKFPGIAAVAAIATLELGAMLTENAEVRNALNNAAAGLTETLALQVESFQRALAA